MTFRVSARTLERLEWPELVARWVEQARTPQARAWLEAAAGSAELFAGDLASVRTRLGETDEARAVLAAGSAPPLGGVRDLAGALARAARGGALGPADLLAVASTLGAARDTGRFLATRAESAPGLVALAGLLGGGGRLAERIGACFDAEGELRDDASRELGDARRESRRLAAEAQGRIERMLATFGDALSDRFYTVRGDRYVLPVRAEARGRVPGIVHDASASGATVFVEPDALVELNNRHKQAELRIEREARRILRELAEAVASEREAIEAELGVLQTLDLAFARAALSSAWEGVTPEVGDAGVFRLEQLRHPLVPPDEVVPNDLRVGEGFHVLVLSGPNAGGKTVAMKAVALAALCTRAGLQVPAAPGARVDPPEQLLGDIGDEQSLRENLSTFSAHVANLASIVREADARSLVVLDEVGVGTDPGEGAAIAQAVLEALAARGARVVATTHYNLLKELAEVDPRFENASVEFDPETLAPTYRVRIGAAGVSSATAVAARMGMPAEVLERASALLEREDRALDKMLAELGASRAALERERSEAQALRAEGAQARDAYRHKLERLQERRDALFASMRSDLDHAFRTAHDEVAGVIRELQRKGTAQDAARARERLLALEAESESAETSAREREPAPPPAAPLDWRRARAGDAVTLPGGGRGVLVALPDRRGRATVQVGGTRVRVPADQLAPAAGQEPAPEARRSAARVRTPAPPAGAAQCDLRGLRVDEALDRLVSALDAATLAGRRELEIVHGIGTGALTRAVREHLRASPYVSGFAPAPPEAGGDGATVVRLD